MKIFYSGNPFYWYNLEGSNDNGEFSRKVLVNGSGPAFDAGGPADYATLKSPVSTYGKWHKSHCTCPWCRYNGHCQKIML